MPNTAEITAKIVEDLAARGWAITPCAGESDCWLASRDSSAVEILLVLHRAAVAEFVGGLIAGYLPHEVIDGVGSSPIAGELASATAESLDGALTATGPGLLTEVGIRKSMHGKGGEVYAVRAMRAAAAD